MDNVNQNKETLLLNKLKARYLYIYGEKVHSTHFDICIKNSVTARVVGSGLVLILQILFSIFGFLKILIYLGTYLSNKN